MGIGRADDFRPVVADPLLRRISANLMLEKDVFDHGAEFLCRAFSHARRDLVWDPTQGGHQIFGDSAKKRGRIFRHGKKGDSASEPVLRVRARKGGYSGRMH